jgi:predicted O-methyltransferase YrrM
MSEHNMAIVVRNILDGLMPGPVKRRLRVFQQRRDLQRVPKLSCKSERLLRADAFKLKEIFSSVEIGHKWSIASNDLRKFEIPDGIGGVNPGDRRAVFYIVSYFKPRSVLEVGTHLGASTIHIAAALRSAHTGNHDRRVVSVDISDVNDRTEGAWSRLGLKFSPRDMVTSMGCGDFVRFVTSPSLDYIRQSKEKYDFIFLDGDHAAKTVYREIPAALELLHPNGLILLHDYFPALQELWSDGDLIPGPFLAMARLKAEGGEFQALPLGSLPWQTKSGSSVTSLALLAGGL